MTIMIIQFFYIFRSHTCNNVVEMTWIGTDDINQETFNLRSVQFDQEVVHLPKGGLFDKRLGER